MGRTQAHGGRHRDRALLRSALVALIVLTIAGPTAAARAVAPQPAQPVPPAPAAETTNGDGPVFDAESLGLVVTAGFDGLALRNTFMPVTVHLEPTRLFSGVVEVASSTGAVETREVEVAGSSAKQFTFVVPSGQVRIRVRSDGSDQAVQVRPDINGSPAGVLVGIGQTDGAPLTGVPNATLREIETRILFVPFDVTLLERSSQVVGSLGTLILDADDLEALGDLGRRNLEAAVLDGLNLVLTLGPGPTPDILPWRPATAVTAGTGATPPSVTPSPDAWAMDAQQAELAESAGLAAAAQDVAAPVVAASVPAGRGRVVMTGLSPTSGPGATGPVWGLLAAQRDATGQLDGEFTSQRGWLVSQALAGGGDLDLPGLGLLAVFALLYVLAAGPGNALLLRRLGRNELGWITLPAITVVFLAGAFITASGTQPTIGLAGGVRTWVDGTGTELALAAVRAPSAGEHTLLLPGADWDVDGTAETNGIQVRLDRSTGDVRAIVELQSLQVGTVVAERSLDEAAPLDLDVRVDDGAAQVTVTNVSTRRITDIEVRAAGTRTKVGDLEPGASADVSIPIDRLAALPVYEDPFGELRDFNGQVEAPASFRALLRGTLLSDRPGQVVAIGEMVDATTAILADDTPAQALGDLVAVASTLPFDGVVHPGSVDRALLVGPFQQAWQPSAHAVEGQLTAHLRYRLPAGSAGRVASLVPDLARGEGFIEGGFNVPMPDVPPGPLAGGVCVEVTDLFPDGGAGTSQSCGDIEPEMPGCPDDALTCEFGTDFWVFEFDDGRRQEGRITFQVDGGVMVDPGGGRQGLATDLLEVLDPTTGRWTLLSQLVAADGTLSVDHVSPFGEVVIRITGGLYPFDYSARGIGATLTGVTA